MTDARLVSGASGAALLPFIACITPWLFLALGACRAPLPTQELKYRREHEQSVKTELSPAESAHFKGPQFYPFHWAYRFRATIEPVNSPEPLTIAASNGEQRPAHRVGRVRLRFPKGEARLSIYQLDDVHTENPDYLFLPFRDAGAGNQTYGAGRYLDVERLSGGVVKLDFNRAYNPACAYGIGGRCPITPPESTVPFAIAAGEMIPPGHA